MVINANSREFECIRLLIYSRFFCFLYLDYFLGMFCKTQRYSYNLVQVLKEKQIKS